MTSLASFVMPFLAMVGLTGCVSSGRIADCMWEKAPNAAREVVSASDTATAHPALMVGYDACGRDETLIALDEQKLIQKLREKDPVNSSKSKATD